MSEKAKEDTYETPPTDPAQALRDACQMIKQMMANQEAERKAHEVRMEELGKTIDLSAADIAKLKAEWEADHQEKVKQEGIFKRVFMMFVSLKGWNKE